MAGSAPLPRRFYRRSTVEVARDLIGVTVRHVSSEGIVSGRIVETEAYLGRDDPASHAFRGPTPRASIMYGPVGMAYVYLSYGVHYCLNAVAHAPGAQAGAVLIRAIEPLEGVSAMSARRKREKLRDLGSGPGKLTQALGIDLGHNGLDLTTGDLVFAPGESPIEIVQATRIGIRKAVDRPYRFFEAGNPHVSKRA